MSMRLQRFDFAALRDFRGPLQVAPEEELAIEDAVVPPPPPTFSEQELEDAKAIAQKLGYSEGYQAGLEHAAAQADVKRVAAERIITQLAAKISTLEARYQELLDTEAEQLSAMVLKITRKVTDITLSADGGSAVMALVKKCLPILLSKPQLVIELHTSALEHTMDRIEKLLAEQGFEGQVQFRTNDAIAPYDTVVDWGAGQARRDTGALWNEIEQLLATTPITLAQSMTDTSTTATAEGA